MDDKLKFGIPIVILIVIIAAIIPGIISDSSDEEDNTDETSETEEQENNILSNSQMSDDNTSDNLSKLNKYDSAPEILSDDEIKNKKSVLVTDKGTIEIELFADEAPLTVSNHVFLVNDDFYNNLTFHRREEGFVIQGGDPAANGTGGPGYRFEDEPVNREYTRGIVAMANGGPNTNGSQFFIMLEDNFLPPQYTIFGEVISGLDVVDQIQIGDTIQEAKIEDM